MVCQCGDSHICRVATLVDEIPTTWGSRHKMSVQIISAQNPSQICICFKKMAESEGFEPPEQLLVQQISNLPRSTTPTTFHLYYQRIY